MGVTSEKKQELLKVLKFNLRESKKKAFEDDELELLLQKNNYDVEKASYEGLLIKAENTAIKLPGLDIPSSQKYFLRLAKLYRPSSSSCMKRADER
ncbi:hypothetical protein [Tepidibacter hydrothermalis]|uniref:Bacteriocin immunity protein n=1 Tax=Tepidibacter hydrothermalis TaxID=3036126 RepID=A0ABY8EGD9_9FIRM|nr:hypothetical protein [Tepidibacter hydrothermalis]WFD12009.1 hypothetical protein P4S50_08000 [Tepidibacter hydrothermalis]